MFIITVYTTREMYFLVLLVFTLPLGLSCIQSLIIELIRREHVNVLILFNCHNSKVEMFRYLNENFWGSVHSFDVADERFFDDHHRFMLTQHYRLGVVADLRCPRIGPLLVLCSERYYFNASYSWVLLGGDDFFTLAECFEEAKFER